MRTGFYIDRLLDLEELLRHKSHFLLGPRQTGKTFLIRHTLPNVKLYNLLETETFLNSSRDPKRIRDEFTARDRIIVIDEIQRLPELLNEVQLLIEQENVKFLLTGSSARKLRRGGVNLLGGRARIKYLHPLTYPELGKKFNLYNAVERGTLPSIYFSDSPDEDLSAYAGLYLQEEVVAEGAVRNIPSFSRFLKIAALCNATIVNFTNLANDAQVARTTIYEYFDILKDTLIIYEVPAWKKSKKRKPLSSSKYYFFDAGVARILQGRTYRAKTPEFGEGFETFLFHELISFRDYAGGQDISFWRSASGYEVDFILGDHTAIEVKAKENVSNADLKSLLAISEESHFKRHICVCMEKRPRKIKNIMVLPYNEFLTALWDGLYK